MGEVFHNGEWGTVCDDEFGFEDANFVCIALGYHGAVQYYDEAEFGEGTGPIWADDLACTWDSPDMDSCMTRDWGTHNCDHSEDVSVECTAEHLEVAFRL